jgi:uncharacterized tellurite resistance protein B-like protein
MFLNRLNDKEKVSFLKVAHYVALSDNDFSESQESIIEKYCMEMQVSDVDFDMNKFDIKRELSEVTDPVSRKIFLLEVMALVYSDSYLHPDEKKVLDEMIMVFDLKDALAVVYSEWAKSILALYVQGQALLEL